MSLKGSEMGRMSHFVGANVGICVKFTTQFKWLSEASDVFVISLPIMKTYFTLSETHERNTYIKGNT